MNLGLYKNLTFNSGKIYPYATGGEEYFYFDAVENQMYKVHHFKDTGSATLNIQRGGEMDIVLVAGGGGGGHAGRGANTSSNHYVWSGGGGGGGVLEIESYSVSANQTLTFEIGAGGTAGVDGYRGNNGGDTTFNGLTAYGGGGGGGARTNNFSGNNGGAGGGASTYGCCVTSVSGSQNGGSGVSGQGYGGGLATGNNGYGGGGGGAGSSGNANNVATNKGLGGSARVIYTRSFGGGGGAGAEAGSIGQVGGGNAGRGAASRTPGGNGTNGVDGYGGGGGGGSFYNGGNGFLPGKGGNGGVVVAYKYDFVVEPIVTDGLVLRLDAGNPASYSGSGSTWYDLSGGGNNGTLTNGPTYDSANKGSIVFDGTNDHVECSNDSSFQIYEGTISAWIKAQNGNSSYRSIIAKGNAWGIFLYNDIFSTYSWGNVARRETGIDLGDNNWHYVAMSFTNTLGTPSNNAILYVDGISVLTTTVTHSNHNISVKIGENGNAGQEFYGNISSAKIYNRALSSTEITQNFNALRGRYGI